MKLSEFGLDRVDQELLEVLVLKLVETLMWFEGEHVKKRSVEENVTVSTY